MLRSRRVVRTLWPARPAAMYPILSNLRPSDAVGIPHHEPRRTQ
jgi:hypothetical protein